MKDLILKLIERIRHENDSTNPKVKVSLISMIKKLEFNQEFRNYITETLIDEEFHKDFPNSYRSFPFEIITLLYDS